MPIAGAYASTYVCTVFAYRFPKLESTKTCYVDRKGLEKK